MTNRTMIALGAALALAGPAFAQSPAKDSNGAPPVVRVDPAPGCGPTWSECDAGAQPGGHVWVSADLLLSWMSSSPLPTLVTTSPAGTAKAVAGIPGNPTTSTLFGDRTSENVRWGYRVEAGTWLDADHIWGAEIGFMMLESKSTVFSASSDGSTILARPYTDANTGTVQAILIAFPGSSSGSVDVRVRSGNFYEGHFDLTETFANKGGWKLDSILGYRMYRYDEGLRIRQTVNPIDGAFVPGTQIVTVDNFSTQNTFHGCDLGFRAEYCCHDVTVGFLAKCAVGHIHRDVDISGGQVTTVPGFAPAVSAGGVYALSTNDGNHHSGDWTVLPEFGGHVSWQANSHVRLHAGYSILFLDQVARAADQIDQTINPNLFPPVGTSPAGPSQPLHTLDKADVWIQTFNFGVEFTF